MTETSHRTSVPLYARILIGVGLGLGALLGVGWYYADGLVHVRPVRRPVFPTFVRGQRKDRDGSTHVTLTLTPTTLRPGVMRLEWDVPDGHGGRKVVYGELGPILSQTKSGVTRAVRFLDAPLRLGQSVRASTIGLGNPTVRGLPHLDVTVSGEHGPLPSWLIPGKMAGKTPTLADAAGTDWIIVTHGYGGLRQDALRILPTFHRLGLTSLTITYRNAEGAPRTPEKVHRLSAEEWKDLEQAVEYALEHGARRVLLFGFSMGGAITLAFLRYSHMAPLVTAALLDSPALEWRSLITHHAYRYKVPLPDLLSRFVAWLTVIKSKQDFDAVDHLSVMDTFHTPMLMFHGSIDKTVPVAQVETFAHARPDIVEYHRIEGAQHVRTWNIDPEAYEAAVEGFIHRVLNDAPDRHEPPTAQLKENQNA
ncbi:lysophospholipase [Deinococcus sp. KNUC1210]|uniref:alpha/beta hydrolase n=1 Tax=Deinococcus sp. KNUC1210 TaxID=2917691 RepID=UPI001EF13782|nr:alpha/beta hydrolase [Deinococcus sp. KNUC1210]ULH16459.1 lysophospholipase [Deinococcus sp. KNUC1210]